MQAQPPQGQAPQGQPIQGVPAPGAPVVPPVPAGPGVRPPFAAPPVQKAGGTLALGLILGGFAVLLCLVGGGIGIGVAVFSAFQDTDREARAAAGAYLDAIAEERYADAYQMTCTPFRKEVDEQEFVATKQRGARIVDYELSSMVGHEAGVMVPARISLEGGDELTLGLVLAREPVDGASGEDAKTEFRVCGEVKDPGPLPS